MPRQTVYLGIDQSYTGFALAVYQANNNYDVFLRDYSKAKAGTGVDRVLRIEAELCEALGAITAVNDVGHIVMEGYSYGSKVGLAASGELGYAVKRALRTYFGDPMGYPTIVAPTAVKKFCLGHAGRSAKSLMLKTVLQKWGADFDDDNLADAYTLARIAACYQHPERAAFKYEQEVLASLTWHTESGLTENTA